MDVIKAAAFCVIVKSGESRCMDRFHFWIASTLPPKTGAVKKNPRDRKD
jgi:hypothetical protein